MGESDNSDFYSRDSSTYESTRFSSVSGHNDHTRLMKSLSVLATGLDLRDVVEVGVGTGRVTRVLLEQGAEAIRCVDIAPGMLEVAERNTASTRVRYIEGSAYDLPIDTDGCSAFVSVNLVTHLDDMNLFWSEAARVLRPGGMALVTSTKVDSLFLPFGVIANRRGSAYGQNVHTAWHRRKEHIDAISAAGGTVQSIVGHFYTPRVVDRPFVGAVFNRAMRGFEVLPAGIATRLAPMDIYVVRF